MRTCLRVYFIIVTDELLMIVNRILFKEIQKLHDLRSALAA